MSNNKQTVWLVTMLSFMVVISGWYLVAGSDSNRLANAPKEVADLGIALKEVPPDMAVQGKADESMKGNRNYFVGYQLQRGTLRDKMKEEYYKIISNPEASKAAIKEATRKVDELVKVDKKELVLEEMIRGNGYKDVVVISGTDYVDVVVQSDAVSNKQAVDLISLVRQQLNVDPTSISIRNRV